MGLPIFLAGAIILFGCKPKRQDTHQAPHAVTKTTQRQEGVPHKIETQSSGIQYSAHFFYAFSQGIGSVYVYNNHPKLSLDGSLDNLDPSTILLMGLMVPVLGVGAQKLLSREGATAGVSEVKHETPQGNPETVPPAATPHLSSSLPKEAESLGSSHPKEPKPEEEPQSQQPPAITEPPDVPPPPPIQKPPEPPPVTLLPVEPKKLLTEESKPFSKIYGTPGNGGKTLGLPVEELNGAALAQRLDALAHTDENIAFVSLDSAPLPFTDKIHYEEVARENNTVLYRIHRRVKEGALFQKAKRGVVSGADLLQMLENPAFALVPAIVRDKFKKFLPVLLDKNADIKTIQIGSKRLEPVVTDKSLEFIFVDQPTTNPTSRIVFEYPDAKEGSSIAHELMVKEVGFGTSVQNISASDIEAGFVRTFAHHTFDLRAREGEVHFLDPSRDLRLKDLFSSGKKRGVSGSFEHQDLHIDARWSKQDGGKVDWLDAITFQHKNPPPGRKGKTALILYPELSGDKNFAFNTPPWQYIEAFACCYETVKFQRVASVPEIAQVIGGYKKSELGYLSFGGHGSSSGILLAHDAGGKPMMLSKQNVGQLSTINGIPLSEYLARDAHVHIDGCSVGSVSGKAALGNFIDAMSEMVPQHYVWGPMHYSSNGAYTFDLGAHNIRDFMKIQTSKGSVPIVYRRRAADKPVLGPMRNHIDESYDRLMQGRGAFQFYDIRQQKLVDYTSAHLGDLVESVFRYPDHYSSLMLDLFLNRVIKRPDGTFCVINPNQELVDFLSKTKTAVQDVHYTKGLQNNPLMNLEVQGGRLVEAKPVLLSQSENWGKLLRKSVSRNQWVAQDPLLVVLKNSGQKTLRVTSPEYGLRLLRALDTSPALELLKKTGPGRIEFEGSNVDFGKYPTAYRQFPELAKLYVFDAAQNALVRRP